MRLLAVMLPAETAGMVTLAGSPALARWRVSQPLLMLVEPGVPSGSGGRGNGDSGNEIYMEIIREVDPGGSTAQVIRRDVPYLVR